MNRKNSADTAVRQIFVPAIFIILAAQINLDVFTTYFRVSTGIILFPIFVYLFGKIQLIPVTLVSGCGVFLSRIAISGLQNGFTYTDIPNYFPELIFYLVYGTASYIYFHANDYKLQGRGCFAVLFLMDYGANLAELLVRLHLGAFTIHMQLNILIVALVRTVILWAAITGLGHYKFMLLSQEHASRYQRLILLISKLNGEVIWMKKNTALIEETMARSYRLFSAMQEQKVVETLSQDALAVAKDIHEIKKEYMLILRGISEALDLNVQDGTMNLGDILTLLENTMTASANEAGKQFLLERRCASDIHTGQHYFLLSIFRNLFNNAMEANEEGPVRIIFSQEEKDGNYLFTVRDNGPGILEENLPHIFTPGFSTKINFQTGEISRGLGLNLIKDIIENQFHGSIRAESIPGETVFYITVPKTELEVS